MLLSNDFLLLKNLNYIDIKNEIIVENKDILIKDGIIVEIKEDIDSLDSQHIKSIDCSNLWAIPSFIDAHVHITFNPYKIDSFNEKYIFGNLYDAAASGICMVRDLGMHSDYQKDKIEHQIDSLPVPRVIYSGTPICVNNGHGSAFGISLDTDKIKKWIIAHKKQNYEWIKIMNDPENHDIEYLKFFVKTAHKYGLKVACHTFTKKGIEGAIIAKVDTIEHSVPIDYDLKIDNNITFVPTYYSAYISKNEFFLGFLEDTREIQFLLDWYNCLSSHIQQAIKYKIPIICGTDAGICPSSFHDITNEIKMLYHNGMPVIQALNSASLQAAKIMGYEDKYGSIDIGKYANIILLNGNPLEDISFLNHKEKIVLHGVIIKDEVNLK